MNFVKHSYPPNYFEGNTLGIEIKYPPLGIRSLKPPIFQVLSAEGDIKSIFSYESNVNLEFIFDLDGNLTLKNITDEVPFPVLKRIWY